jgi:hypothetical protein
LGALQALDEVLDTDLVLEDRSSVAAYPTVKKITSLFLQLPLRLAQLIPEKKKNFY